MLKSPKRLFKRERVFNEDIEEENILDQQFHIEPEEIPQIKMKRELLWKEYQDKRRTFNNSNIIHLALDIDKEPRHVWKKFVPGYGEFNVQSQEYKVAVGKFENDMWNLRSEINWCDLHIEAYDSKDVKVVVEGDLSSCPFNVIKLKLI